VKKKYKEQVLPILLSLYPKISAIASGATPIDNAVVHPKKKELTKKDERKGKGNESKVYV
jgi:hypothetical protein